MAPVAHRLIGYGVVTCLAGRAIRFVVLALVPDLF